MIERTLENNAAYALNTTARQTREASRTASIMGESEVARQHLLKAAQLNEQAMNLASDPETKSILGCAAFKTYAEAEDAENARRLGMSLFRQFKLFPAQRMEVAGALVELALKQPPSEQ